MRSHTRTVAATARARPSRASAFPIGLPPWLLEQLHRHRHVALAQFLHQPRHHPRGRERAEHALALAPLTVEAIDVLRQRRQSFQTEDLADAGHPPDAVLVT